MPQEDDPQHRLSELLRDAFGAQAAMLLYVAAKLDLAEHLAGGCETPEQLAQAVGADSRALLRILRALVSQGVCDEATESRFHLTRAGEHLRRDHSESICARVILNVEVHHALWGSLLETAKSGQSGSALVHSMPFYQYLASNRVAGEVFDRAMSSAGWVRDRFHAAIDAYDFGRFRTIVDIGGGDGSFLTEILGSLPGPCGIVFDLPRLEARANKVISHAGVEGRCRFIGGDAFAAIPAGADAYVLSNFLNSWGDAQAGIVLRKCREAMQPEARLLVIDWVMPTGDHPDAAKSRDATTMDVVMLAAFGADSGQIRTLSEFRRLLGDSGLELTARIPTRASVELIEARAANAERTPTAD
jgi:hypothetical protein